MSEKMTVLNIRMSVDEKLEIKERAELSGQTISSYAHAICCFLLIIQKMKKIIQI